MTTMENLSLVHPTTTYTAVKTVYEDTFVMFWGLVTFYICLAVVTVIGNSLVIYAAHVHRDNDISKSLALAIKSLAVADMLYGLLGAPFQIYGYYLAAKQEYKITPPDSIDDWRVELINLAPNIFSTSSCIHVALLVLLRYIESITPVGKISRVASRTTNSNKKFCYTAILLIWVLSFIAHFTAVVAQCLEWWSFYYYYRFFKLHFFGTFPIFCIIWIYIRTIKRMKKKGRQASHAIEINLMDRPTSDNSFDSQIMASKKEILCRELQEGIERMTHAIEMVVLCVLLCFVPYLVWMQYYYTVFPGRIGIDDRIDVKDYEVPFAAISRILLLINSFANPFIYAKMIPEFRDIAKNVFTCNRNAN